MHLEIGDGRDISLADSEPVTFQPGRWHHATVVVDIVSGKATFYFDGRDVTLQPATRRDPMLSGALGFGAILGREKHVFPGALNDIRLYARALSPAEIAALAAGSAD